MSNKRSKRQKKTPGWLKEDQIIPDGEKSRSKQAIKLIVQLFIVFCVTIEWCKIRCIEDNKVHTVHSGALETESCDFVTDSDLRTLSTLVWRYKGAPYTVEVLEIHGKHPNLHKSLSFKPIEWCMIMKHYTISCPSPSSSSLPTTPSSLAPVDKQPQGKGKHKAPIESDGSDSDSSGSDEDDLPSKKRYKQSASEVRID